VLVVILALPWAAEGIKRQDSARKQVGDLLTLAKEYNCLRKCTFSEAYMPYSLEPSGTKNITNDFGGCSSLAEALWAVCECQNSGWTLVSIPKLSKDQVFVSHSMVEVPYMSFEIADFEPGTTSPQKATTNHIRFFSPRGILRMLHWEAVLPDGLVFEHILSEEIIRDVLVSTHQEKTICVRTLAKLPIAYDYGQVLAEVAFGQLLCMSRKKTCGFGYVPIIVELCKVPSLCFPRRLSGIIRELFARMDSLDPYVLQTMVNWHTYHLMHVELNWPWEKWSSIIENELAINKRHFCCLVLDKLTRLLPYERVFESIARRAKSMTTVMPPKMRTVKKNRNTDEIEEDGLIGSEANLLLDQVTTNSNWQTLLNHIETITVPRLGGDRNFAVRALTLCLAHMGAKALSFLTRRLERYGQALARFVSGTGAEGAGMVLDTIMSYWGDSPQKMLQALECLQVLYIVQDIEILIWCLRYITKANPRDDFKYLIMWQALYQCVSKVSVRTASCRMGRQNKTENTVKTRVGISETRAIQLTNRQIKKPQLNEGGKVGLYAWKLSRELLTQIESKELEFISNLVDAFTDAEKRNQTSPRNPQRNRFPAANLNYSSHSGPHYAHFKLSESSKWFKVFCREHLTTVSLLFKTKTKCKTYQARAIFAALEGCFRI
jgi:hypothetical protein